MHDRFDGLARVLRSALACALLVSVAGFARGEDEPALRNWGRWGADDERGAANYMTPERIVAAARLIETGKTFSLAIPLDEKGPVYPGRLNPHRTMVISGADYAAGFESDFKFAADYIYMPLQGSTQWDALSHAWYGETLYNGVPESAIRGSACPSRRSAARQSPGEPRDSGSRT